MSPITRLMPMKAMPIVTAARNALPGFAPRIRARKKMIIGRITVAPRLLKNALMAVNITSIFTLSFYVFME
jgi:hypothetical protein